MRERNDPVARRATAMSNRDVWTPKGRRKRCGFRRFKKNGRSMKTDRPLVVPGLPGSSRAAVQP